MTGHKTIPTDASVSTFLAAIDDAQRREDCQALLAMMSRITGQPAVMWGPSIVGFDSYHYRYEAAARATWQSPASRRAAGTSAST